MYNVILKLRRLVHTIVCALKRVFLLLATSQHKKGSQSFKKTARKSHKLKTHKKHKKISSLVEEVSMVSIAGCWLFFSYLQVCRKYDDLHSLFPVTYEGFFVDQFSVAAQRAPPLGSRLPGNVFNEH